MQYNIKLWWALWSKIKQSVDREYWGTNGKKLLEFREKGQVSFPRRWTIKGKCLGAGKDLVNAWANQDQKLSSSVFFPTIKQRFAHLCTCESSTAPHTYMHMPTHAHPSRVEICSQFVSPASHSFLAPSSLSSSSLLKLSGAAHRLTIPLPWASLPVHTGKATTWAEKSDTTKHMWQTGAVC